MFTDLDKHRKLAKLPAPQAYSVKMNLYIRTKKINNSIIYLNIDNAEPISCPFEQSWLFEKDQAISTYCQPKAFHHCSSSNTFQLSYNNRCQTNQGKIYHSFSRRKKKKYFH